MTAPELIPLKQPGDRLTLNVMACAQVPVGKYPEIEFTGTDGNRLVAVRVPKSSADRQLARIDLTYQAAVGKTLTFSRDPNQVDPSKPFWGISLNGAAPAATNGKAKQEKQGIDLGGPIQGLDDDAPLDEPEEATESPATVKLRALFKLHGVCFAHALKMANVAHKDHGITPTLEGVSALCAQAFIAAGQRGV